MESSENHDNVRQLTALAYNQRINDGSATGGAVEEEALEDNKAASKRRTSSSSSSRSNGSSNSSSSSSSSSSAPHYSDNIRVHYPLPTLGLLPSHSSGSSSTKTCEVNNGDDERDTFSPVTSNSPSDAADLPENTLHNTIGFPNSISNTTVIDNKVYERLPPSSGPSQPYPSTSSSCSQAVHKKQHQLLGSNQVTKSDSINNLLPSTSKEEKQRQNEEIVIMETSSVSSETGSWESMFAQNSTNPFRNQSFSPSSTISESLYDIKNNKFNKTMINNENSAMDLLNSDGETNHQHHQHHHHQPLKYLNKVMLPAQSTDKYVKENSAVFPMERSPLFIDEEEQENETLQVSLAETQQSSSIMTTSGTSACFIDASSLRDEDEVVSFPSIEAVVAPNTFQINEENPQKPDIGLSKEEEQDAIGTEADNKEPEDDSPTKQLESFHKTFAKCKSKAKDLSPSIDDRALNVCNTSSSSSNLHSTSELESPKKRNSENSAESFTNNLSDEEHIWKPDQKSLNDIKANNKIFLQESSLPQEDTTEASDSLAPDSSESSYQGKNYRIPERKHDSSLPMQTNIVHFSVHPLGVSPKFPQHFAASSVATSHTTTHSSISAHHSDLSYTTDYSSSSPAPSLVWSDHEHRFVDSDTNTSNLLSAHKTCSFPDTPHNSIVHMELCSSNNGSMHRDLALSSSLSHQRDSGAYCSDATDSPILLPRTPKRSKFDESNPIVSGGASIKDFNVKHCESPTVKRRTDTCPIVSGGFVSLDFEKTRPLDDDDDEDEDEDGNGEDKVELRNKIIRKPLPGIASWVVDMSDCQPERRKSTSSTSSLETSGIKFRERSDSNGSHKSGCGFYIPLDKSGSTTTTTISSSKKTQMSKSATLANSRGSMKEEMSLSEYCPKNVCKTQDNDDDEQSNEVIKNEKKNIFSIFIDIGDKKTSSMRKDGGFHLPQKLAFATSQSTQKKDKALVVTTTEEVMKSSASSTETLMWKSGRGLPDNADSDTITKTETKSLDYKSNLEPPITVAAIRRLTQQRTQNDNNAAKRHSWGTNQIKEKEENNHHPNECKRSISLIANNAEGKDTSGNGLMSIIDKLPLISKASSLSIDSSLSPYDEYTGSKSGRSSDSNNSNRNSFSGIEQDDDHNAHNAGDLTKQKKRRRDVKINETFDKSSIASISDALLSKDLSPASTTDTDDLTFQQDEEIALREACSSTTTTAPPFTTQLSQVTSNRSSAIIMETIIEAKEVTSPKKNALDPSMESLHATIEKQKMMLETVTEQTEQEKLTFVKLSDMDKPVKLDKNSPEAMSKSVGNHRQLNRLFRDDTKAARPHSWTMTRSTGNSFLNITNSVDNIRSLSRLFPHFSKEFTSSLPNDVTLSQMDYIQTDLSNDSSLASSFSRSGMDESSISCRQPRRLGEDLLKMFLQEIATDMIVEVHGRRIKAHKCILRSRCQYFAAMLAGNNSQSVVSLQGYSYTTVHFALCHIYSGASHPPEGISLMELAALADLLGLEGLKEVTSHALKTNYCHNFHKPCSGCIDGILQVLPVALNHALDDLYRKCLRWTCRHYMKVWPTRQFSQLSPDILGRCRQQIVAYLSSESVLDTILDCNTLLGLLATYRWGSMCENLVRDIVDAAYVYIADHFASLIASDAFLSLGHDHSGNIPRLENVLLRTASNLSADQSCRSYQRITRLNTVLQAKVIQMPSNLGEYSKELQGLQEEELEWDPDYIRLVSALLSAIEQCLIRQCSRAMRVASWQRMDLDLRKKIQTLARLTEPLDLKRNNNKAVGKAFSFGGSSRNQDLYQVRLAIQAHSKKAMAQEAAQAYKATQTNVVGNVQTTERGVQANHDIKEANAKILKSNTRTHVPMSLTTDYSEASQVSQSTDRKTLSLPTHRRSQSEVHSSSTAVQKQENKTESNKSKNAMKLTEVRPRYLEPRRPRSIGNKGPVKSATSTAILSSNKPGNYHSSDSSRNSSPATTRKGKSQDRSSNKSLDNLSTSSRRCRSSSSGKTMTDKQTTDRNTGSMADSMKSSIITNKTISQESLASGSKISSSNSRLLTKTNKVVISGAQKSKNHNIENKNVGFTGMKHTKISVGSSKISNGSSPSSVITNKSATSRLSSVSSTQSSRDLYKHRSISVPSAKNTADITNTQTRYSFLSAKSREILAKRAEKNKNQKLVEEQQNQTQEHFTDAEKEQSPQTNLKYNNKNSMQQLMNHSSTNVSSNKSFKGPLRSASYSAVSTIMQTQARSIQPSNIPMRRPNTTISTKRSTQNTQPALAANLINQLNKNAIQKINGNERKHLLKKSELLIENGYQNIDDEANIRDTEKSCESKLERSSTFCKESAELETNELHIVE